MRKPVMKSEHAFTDYLGEQLGRVRCLKKLSGDDPYFVELDKRMGERWSSVINGRSPTPEQRKAALQERLNVSSVYPRIEGSVKQLLTTLHSMHAYVVTLPPPMLASSGWETRSDLLHPDNAIKLITIAIDTIKYLRALDTENAYLTSLWEQVQEIARWTRTSLNPSVEERTKIKLNEVNFEQLTGEVQRAVLNFCQGFHDFCELYSSFPARPPMPRIQLDKMPGA